LLSVQLLLTAEQADLLGDALLESGALSVSVEDADAGGVAERPIFGEPGATPQFWDACQLIAHFAPDADVDEILRASANALDLELPPFAIAQVEDIDWVRANREQFQPIPISQRIWIVPTWHANATLPAGTERILLDPGAAFGTGSHPTTRLCLRWLESELAENPARTVLDYGSGSGILAIAALKLGAASAVGVDIDEQALETARDNARLNEVTATFRSGADPLALQADITVANILSHPLIMLAPLLAAHTKVRGRLALSGILATQAEEVLATYRQWFDIAVAAQDEDWVCLAGTRVR
jgi:ribosomal protein L11 methyltransferase